MTLSHIALAIALILVLLAVFGFVPWLAPLVVGVAGLILLLVGK